MSGTTPTMRRGSGLTPMNFMTPSVHSRWRLSAVRPGKSFAARLSLMMTTRSESWSSSALKSRPALSGQTERREVSGRHRTELRTWIVAVLVAPFSVDPEAEREPLERAEVAPRDGAADRHAFDASDARPRAPAPGGRTRGSAIRSGRTSSPARRRQARATCRSLETRPAAPGTCAAASRRRRGARTTRQSA